MKIKQITKRLMSSNKTTSPFIPVRTYWNADLQKSEICKHNKNKTGIYRSTHQVSGKSYIGSSVNLTCRFIQYYNINRLETEKKKK